MASAPFHIVGYVACLFLGAAAVAAPRALDGAATIVGDDSAGNAAQSRPHKARVDEVAGATRNGDISRPDGAAAPVEKGKQAPSASPVLWEMLRSPDPGIREQAIEGLASVGGAESIGAVLRGLLDPDARVRAAAGKTLASLAPDEVFDQIMTILCAGSYESVASLDSALPLLGRSLEKRLMTTLESDLEPLERRVAAAYALGRMGSRHATRALANCVWSPSPELAFFSADALARTADPAAFGLFVELTGHPLWEVRSAAIYALSRVGGNAAADVLKEIVSGATGADDALREQAADALAMMGDESVVPLLVATMESDVAFRETAANTLHNITGVHLGNRPRDWVEWLEAAEREAMEWSSAAQRAAIEERASEAREYARRYGREAQGFLESVGLRGLARFLSRLRR
ncbi:MAG TPA: HEAT repeat domain-containing protein [Candidatus Hydrogenedentes bacterium]|nr:HEAT repeat domain-containing protein [Candidatus Hydrogenedentota bacterium]